MSLNQLYKNKILNYGKLYLFQFKNYIGNKHLYAQQNLLEMAESIKLKNLKDLSIIQQIRPFSHFAF